MNNTMDTALDFALIIVLLLWTWKDRNDEIFSINSTITGNGYPIHEDKYSIKNIWVFYLVCGVAVYKIIELLK